MRVDRFGGLDELGNWLNVLDIVDCTGFSGRNFRFVGLSRSKPKYNSSLNQYRDLKNVGSWRFVPFRLEKSDILTRPASVKRKQNLLMRLNLYQVESFQRTVSIPEQPEKKTIQQIPGNIKSTYFGYS